MNNKDIYSKTLKGVSWSLLCLLLSIATPSQANKIGGIEFKENIKLGEANLLLNGAGQRTKYFVDLYIAALYLTDKTQDAQAIIDADKVMLIQIHVISNLITSENLSRGTAEGFNKSTGNNTKAIQSQIDGFLDAFKDPITLGDIFEIVYQPGIGVTVVKNRHITKRLPADMAFKRALFGIWLSGKPAQTSLKNSMLGKTKLHPTIN